MSKSVVRFGDQPPLAVRAAQATAHGAWRYRVQLAPLYTAAGLATAGGVGHLAGWGEYWALGAGATLAATTGCWLYHRVKETALGSAAWVTATTGASGAWLTAALANGILERPLPDLLALGTLVLGAPWWINRRTRSRVEVEKRIESWPAIARTRSELRGSEVVKATATAFGWTARIKLAAGQTGSGAVEARDGIESALELREGAVRIEPSKRNRREVMVHVTEVDPHAEPVIWPGPSMSEISDPLMLGPYDDGQDCAIQLFKPGYGIRHMMVCGLTGSGKSGMINLVLSELAALGNVVFWLIDLKGGQELGPWKDLADRDAQGRPRIATNLNEAREMLQAAERVIAWRGENAGERVWTPTRERPALVIIADEAAKLFGVGDPKVLQGGETLVLQGRSVAAGLVAAAQDTTTAAWGSTQLRDQLSLRIGFRLKRAKAKYMFEQLEIDPSLLAAIDEDTPGIGYVEAPGVKRPAPMRVRWVADDVVEGLVARHAQDRPRLDEGSEAAADLSGKGASVSFAASSPHPDTEETAVFERDYAMPARPDDEELEAIPDDLSALSLRSMGSPPSPAQEETKKSDQEAITALWQALAQAPESGLRLAAKDTEQTVGRKKSWIYKRIDEWEEFVVKAGPKGGYRLRPGAPTQAPVLTPA